MVDTGAENSVLLKPGGSMFTKTIWIWGVGRGHGIKPYSWTTQRTVNLGMGWVSHSSLVIPSCPYPFLVQDFLSKIKAQIHFSDKGAKFVHQNGEPVRVLVTSDLRNIDFSKNQSNLSLT